MPNSNLERAVQFAVAHETPWSREIDDKWGIHHEDPPPWNRLLGPVHARGSVSGTLIMGGKTLISWGEPNRPDLTFSIAKTYLALLAGVAYDRGLLPDVDEPVGARISGIGFEKGRNAQVTWAHLLQQTRFPRQISSNPREAVTPRNAETHKNIVPPVRLARSQSMAHAWSPPRPYTRCCLS